MLTTGRPRRRGGYYSSWIGTQVINRPALAEAEILEAVDRSRGRLRNAALELGVDRRQLQRFCWQLALWPKVDAIRDAWREQRIDTPVTRLLGPGLPGLTRVAP